jgi:hypothetical protein
VRRGRGNALLVAAVAAAAAGVFALPAVPQDPAYHSMADRRTLLGIPHALNVLSNMPFAAAGGFGLAAVAGARRRRPAAFDGPWHAGAYVALFGGVALTSIGSSYYHLAPDNERLVWDRLPMAVGFMGLVAAMLTERVWRGLARVLLAPLLALGAFSVAWWAWTEGRGAGDLRLYGLVQFGSLAVVVLLLVLYRDGPSRSGRYIWAALALYGLAKVFEALDAPIFEIGGVVSGHTLKHLAAAAGIVPLAVMIRRRTT